MMYLARVVAGCEPSVFELHETEYALAGKNGHVRPKVMKRAKSSWRMTARGVVGAAAISDTPHSAIGAAKCVLELVYIERADRERKRRHD